jgi:hypothetical protein
MGLSAQARGGMMMRVRNAAAAQRFRGHDEMKPIRRYTRLGTVGIRVTHPCLGTRPPFLCGEGHV